MGENFSAIYEYLWAVFYKWWWLMTAILFVVDKVLEWTWPSYRAWLNETFPFEERRHFFWWVLLVFVFIAGFLAWKEEHKKCGEMQSSLKEKEKEIGLLKAQPDHQEVEKLRAQVTEMEVKFAPRHIKDMNNFVRVLSSFGGQKIDVVYVEGDGETFRLFDEICFVAKESRWIIESAVAQSGATWDGVIIEVNDLYVVPQAAGVLANLLAQQKIVVDIDLRSGPLEPDRFAVRVGYKPGRRVTD